MINIITFSDPLTLSSIFLKRFLQTFYCESVFLPMTKLNIAPHLDRSRQTSRKGTWGSGGRRLSCQTVAGRVVPGHWLSSLDKRADPRH